MLVSDFITISVKCIMDKVIDIKGRNIEYTHKINKRGRSIRIAVHPGGRVILSSPRLVPQFIINKFLYSKSDWLFEKIDYFSTIPNIPRKSKKEIKEEYLKYKDKAKEIATERLRYFNKFYGFKWERILIKNQKTRWGSCSRSGNLNFNYRIIFLNKEQIDYIVVHELCHLKEFNHSDKFWKLIEENIPDFKNIRKSLKSQSLILS